MRCEHCEIDWDDPSELHECSECGLRVCSWCSCVVAESGFLICETCDQHLRAMTYRRPGDSQRVEAN